LNLDYSRTLVNLQVEVDIIQGYANAVYTVSCDVKGKFSGEIM